MFIFKNHSELLDQYVQLFRNQWHESIFIILLNIFVQVFLSDLNGGEKLGGNKIGDTNTWVHTQCVPALLKKWYVYIPIDISWIQLRIHLSKEVSV